MLNALDIAQRLHGRLFGDGSITVNAICPVSDSRPAALAIVLTGILPVILLSRTISGGDADRRVL